MGAGGNGIGLAARHRDAPLEAYQLQRDLSLVVIHGHHHVEVARQGADEQRIRGVGARHVPPRLLHHFLNGGLDHIHFLTSAQAELAAVGVQSRHRDPRLVPEALTGDLRQLDGLPQVLLRDVGAYLADGDMAGGPHRHQVVHHVDLAEWRGQIERVGQVCMFALVVKARHLHGALVEGPEYEALNLPGLAQVNGRVQLQKVAGAAVLIGLSVDHLFRILILQVQHRVAPGPVALTQIADDVVGHIPSDHLQPVLEHPHVADDHRTEVIRVKVLHSQLGHQLRAYTGRVAQQHANNRQFAHVLLLHFFSRSVSLPRSFPAGFVCLPTIAISMPKI